MLSALLVSALVLPFQAPPVSLKTLLPEMTDLARLARRPSPSYTYSQASSYDRASKGPGNEAWFANADAGKFLSSEKKDGRTEYLMADLKGPGAVVRIWSANPVGMARFYFDGEKEPRFVWNLADLLQGRIRPFVEPIGYNSSRGCNLYFPIPYERSLRITVDDSKGDGVRGLYYHVGYRTYAPSTRTKSLTAVDIQDAEAPIAETAAELGKRFEAKKLPAVNVRKTVSPFWYEETLIELPAATLLSGALVGGNSRLTPASGAITLLRLRFKHHDPPAELEELRWDHPKQLHQALRRVRLVMDFDGQRTVDVPVPDFFVSAAGELPYSTEFTSASEDGWLSCRFVMPFAASAKVSLVSHGGPPLDVEFEAAVEPFRFDQNTYLFHAQWQGGREYSRPFRDMEFLRAQGEGLFVGAALHVGNPTGAWWGEGDEKVFVDGEAFPSTFGTGTEDYFGYAWCCPDPFQRPYNAQPRCDGPANRGHTNVVRWHLFDPIPYTRSLDFLMELWHWAEVEVEFDRTAYWYARPGGTLPKPVANPKVLWLTDYPKPAPIKGAIEGEKMEILSRSGGATELQGFSELSNGSQLWWRDAAPGDKLTLRIPVKEAAEYEVSGNFCMARDYGIHKLTLGGKPLSPGLDFFSADLKWQLHSLGRVKLSVGNAELVVECAGHRSEAIPRNMFGLDYLMLKKVG